MDCRETQTLLTAFHDGELPAAERVRVEEHLRGCPGCAALRTDLARADQAAGVPDPGPAYWDRFNARVMDRVEREADGPKVAVLRPKAGWMRQQFRYLVPAAAAAALVVVVVRYGGMTPGTPIPTVPPAASERADATEKAESTAVARPAPPQALAKEQFAAATREEERNQLAARSPQGENVEASRDRAAAPAATSAPLPPPQRMVRGAPAGSPPVTAEDGMTAGMQAERKKMAGAAMPMAEPQGAAKATSTGGMRMASDPSAETPCELARTLAERDRFREAEAAQRACLAQDPSAPAREKGLVFLAELLDRQARFAEADAVIAEVDRQYPQSRPLGIYLQQRPMVQKYPSTAPVTR
jgi:tetratricopeptide (TPR) repeat protein